MGMGHAADLPPGRNSDIAELAGRRLGGGRRRSLAIDRGRADDLRERQRKDRRGFLRRVRAGCEQAAARQHDSDMDDTEPLDLPACILAPWSLGSDRFVDLPPAAA